MLARHKALALLTQCTGETIWPLEHCRQQGVPEDWIEELADAFESGFDSDRQTIYLDERQVNQFHGVRDVDLAIRVGQALGVDVEGIRQRSLSRSHLVQAIKESVFEG